MLLNRSLIVIFTLLWASASFAQAPKVGRGAAAKYFQQNPGKGNDYGRQAASEEDYGGGDRYLSLGVSSFTKSEGYEWGVNKEDDVGKWGVDLNYRLSSYSDLLDYSLKVAYTEYEPINKRANKLSFMYAATLPDARSQFPLYFGGAAGPGVFLTQIPGESVLTLDYQLYLGLRIFGLTESTGFYIEGGMKNHLQLTSAGQLNGTYISAGAIFTF